MGIRGSVVESYFYTKLKKLAVPEDKEDKLFADHVTQVCEAHNQVILSFLQQVQGLARPTTEGLRKNIGHNVHVYRNVRRNTCSLIVKAGAIEQCWNQYGKLGTTIQELPRVRKTDMCTYYCIFTYLYCILSRLQICFSLRF